MNRFRYRSSVTNRRSVMLNKKKMKYIKLSILLILITLVSCHEEKLNKLKTNKVFSESETIELISLLDRFDKKICKIESKSEGNFKDCYDSFYKRILKEIETGDYDIGIDKENQKEIVELLNPKLRNEFWVYGKVMLNRRIPNTNSNETFPDSIQSIHINKGKYLDYLEKEISQINPKTKLYIEKFSMAGDISPSIFADVVKNYGEYDIEDERIRLLIAIHYLTINHRNLEMKASYARLENDIKNEFENRRKK